MKRVIVVIALLLVVSSSGLRAAEIIFQKDLDSSRKLVVRQRVVDPAQMTPELLRLPPDEARKQPPPKVVVPQGVSVVTFCVVRQGGPDLPLYGRIIQQYHMSNRAYRPVDVLWQDGGSLIILAEENLAGFSLTLVGTSAGTARVVKIGWNSWLIGRGVEQMLSLPPESGAAVSSKLIIDADNQIVVEITDNRPSARNADGTALVRRMRLDRETERFTVDEQGGRKVPG